MFQKELIGAIKSLYEKTPYIWNIDDEIELPTPTTEEESRIIKEVAYRYKCAIKSAHGKTSTLGSLIVSYEFKKLLHWGVRFGMLPVYVLDAIGD